VDLFRRNFPVEPIIYTKKVPRVRFKGDTAHVFSRFVGSTLTEYNYRFPEKMERNAKALQKQAINLLSTLYAEGVIHGHPGPANWAIQQSRGKIKLTLIDWDAARKYSPLSLKSKGDLEKIIQNRGTNRFSEMDFLHEMGLFFGNPQFPQAVIEIAWKKIARRKSHE